MLLSLRHAVLLVCPRQILSALSGLGWVCGVRGQPSGCALPPKTCFGDTAWCLPFLPSLVPPPALSLGLAFFLSFLCPPRDRRQPQTPTGAKATGPPARAHHHIGAHKLTSQKSRRRQPPVAQPPAARPANQNTPLSSSPFQHIPTLHPISPNYSISYSFFLPFRLPYPPHSFSTSLAPK